ncbi:MAG: DUF4105 domain-containing protein [Duncaniella sp.]|nr:DUF4105 domain-containing protein [Duncaniella sp.]
MRIAAFLLLWAGALPAARAEAPKVSLLVCEAGHEIYELEGHAALRVVHPDYGDFTVNWGVFDFNSPNFVYRFVKGETDYIAAAAPTRYFLNAYAAQGRPVVELDLNLDSVQAEEVTRMVLENIRPENRTYRYNYVLDNCATRPLAVIEQAVGDSLRLAPVPLTRKDASTFRNVMRHFHVNYPWYQFGIDTALGSGIDRPISERENSFAPLLLAPMVADATLPSGAPVVTGSRYLVGSADTPTVTAGPTPWWLTPMAAALAVLALSVAVSVGQLRGKKKAARWFDTVWFTLTGLEGLLLTFLIFVSVHEATSPNWLYLWLNPAAFIGAVAPWLKKGTRLQFTYQSVNFALLIALAAIFVSGVQSPNPAFIPLMTATALRSVTIIYTCLHPRSVKK